MTMVANLDDCCDRDGLLKIKVVDLQRESARVLDPLEEKKKKEAEDDDEVEWECTQKIYEREPEKLAQMREAREEQDKERLREAKFRKEADRRPTKPLLWHDAFRADAADSVQEPPSTSLQHDFVRVDASDLCVQISRTRAEMINGPRRSRIDWNPTEIEASKVGKPRKTPGFP